MRLPVVSRYWSRLNIVARIPGTSTFASRLFDSHAFCEVPRFIHVAAAHDGDVIGEQLQGNHRQQRLQTFESVGNVNYVVGFLPGYGVAFGGDDNHRAFARFDFLDVGHRFVGYRIFRRDEYRGRARFDERNRAVFHFGGRITFDVDVRNFLELERAFKRNREIILPGEEQEVIRLAIFFGDGGNGVDFQAFLFFMPPAVVNGT